MYFLMTKTRFAVFDNLCVWCMQDLAYLWILFATITIFPCTSHGFYNLYLLFMADMDIFTGQPL